MALSCSLLLALALDALFGEPRRWHPLAAFGGLADAVEERFNHNSRWAGVWAVLALTVVPSLVVCIVLSVLPVFPGWAAALVMAGLCIGRRSLFEHIRAVVEPLGWADRAAARQRVGWLVSRETDQMDAAAIRRATIESLLENTSDAVVGTLFWFTVGGLLAGPGGAAALAVWHRLANTLDAMWGYRSTRFARFGWAAARLDDALNWLPARVTALAFALVGATRNGLVCWRTQAGDYASPNAGPVMSAGAGALGVRLGGGAYYRGVWEPRPVLGCGSEPAADDCRRALGLVSRALVLICVCVVCLDWLI